MTFDLPFHEDEIGALTLGVIPEEALRGEEIRIPLSHRGQHPVKDWWHFGVDSVSVTGRNATVISPIEHFVTLEFGPGLAFPKNMTDAIFTAIGVKDNDSLLPGIPEVDCSRWDDLPDIILKFGEQEIVIEKEEYGIRYLGREGLECAILIGENWFDWEPIALGTDFMKKYYVTFDMDEDAIRCKI